jgi:aspartokinase-like uncharacterized kinase
VALLLEERLAVRTVVKVGGGLLVHEAELRDALELIDGSSCALIVPGGGPFADAVRDAYDSGAVDDDAAHWMAVLAMDQYAELLVSRIARGSIVRTPSEASRAASAGLVPILAPARWLRQSDPLPHSWDVTSDSIAAWIAGQIGARRLVLVKPPGATGNLVDAYFERALPAGLDVRVVPADDRSGLKTALYDEAV